MIRIIVELTFVELVALRLDLVSRIRRENHIVHEDLKDTVGFRKFT